MMLGLSHSAYFLKHLIYIDLTHGYSDFTLLPIYIYSATVHLYSSLCCCAAIEEIALLLLCFVCIIVHGRL